MAAHPTALSLTTDGALQISWSDGENRVYSVRELREACPCATCREKKTTEQSQPAPMFKILRPEETQPLAIAGMEPVGNYAYSIGFSDGQDTGIYTLELLRSLGQTA